MIASPQDARACACCTNVGQRYDAVDTLDSGRLDEMERLRFGPMAELFTGEADPDMIKGIAAKASRYSLQVTREKGRWVFAFRDEGGRTGTLALTLPKSVAVLAVDTRRGSREGGTGPALYYEWKLTPVRRAAASSGRVQARGNASLWSCRATATAAPTPATLRTGC